jgi:hypothetical protein
MSLSHPSNLSRTCCESLLVYFNFSSVFSLAPLFVVFYTVFTKMFSSKFLIYIYV